MRFGLLAAVLALAAPLPALAQSCRIPDDVALPPPVQPDGPSVNAPIGGYTLALSWSPGFCHGHHGGDHGPDYQCSGALGRLGFVLHGLWPEAASGPPPQWCAAGPRETIADIRGQLCLTPTPWLIEHEWLKHGTCMARTPAGYFRAARILWGTLRLGPATALAGRRGLRAGDLRHAIAAANPALNPRGIGLVLGGGGWLHEVHLCYSAKFMPAACDARGYGPDDAVPLKIDPLPPG